MPHAIFWTPERLRVAHELACEIGCPKAAEELSLRWKMEIKWKGLWAALRRAKLAVPHVLYASSKPVDDFEITPDGFDSNDGRTRFDLKAEAKARRLLAEAEAARRRQESDFAALKPSDFDVGPTNQGHSVAGAGAEKRQEFTQEHGDFLELIRASGGDPARMPEPEAGRSALYMANLSEQERRFQNRRLARSTAIYAANEGLHLRMMMQCAKDYFAEKVVASGYGLQPPPARRLKRTVVCLWTDQHFGSELRASDNPERYTAEEESRRFAKVVANALHYKPEHREDSELLILDGGDNMDGALWDQRDGAPLVEQKAALLNYRMQALALLSRAYKRVHVEWQPGNHGRDKARHFGRATSSKFDGHEWWVGYALSQACKGLKNVTFSIPFRAVSVVERYGQHLLLTHGDTEISLQNPDTGAEHNANELAKINSNRTYGVEFEIGCFGHFHKYRPQPFKAMRAIFNGALVPPNGHARSKGYTNERQGQAMWEWVEGYPFGDSRFIEVGPTEDKDERLSEIIAPFRFAL